MELLLKFFLSSIFVFSSVESLNYLDDVPDCVPKKCGYQSVLPSKDRTKYYTCDPDAPDLNLQPQSCDNGLWFNNYWKFCDYPERWINPCIYLNICIMRVNPECQGNKRNYLYPSQIKNQVLHCIPSTYDPKYYELTHKGYCPDGDWFDYKTQHCIPKEDWTHPCVEYGVDCWEPRLHCGADQANMTFPSMYPNSYYTCVEDDYKESYDGILFPKQEWCSDDLLYNAHTQSCMPAEDWEKPCFTINTDCLKITCEEHQRHLLWPSEIPTEFIYCHPVKSSKNHMIWEQRKTKCSNGWWFSFGMQMCVNDYNWQDPCTSQPEMKCRNF